MTDNQKIDPMDEDVPIDYTYYELRVTTDVDIESVFYISNEVSDGEIMEEICCAFFHFPALKHIGYLKKAPHWNSIRRLSLKRATKEQWETYYDTITKEQRKYNKEFALGLFEDIGAVIPYFDCAFLPSSRMYEMVYEKTPLPQNGLPSDAWITPPALVAERAQRDAQHKKYWDSVGTITLPVYVIEGK